jgi:hypothetical protein
MKEKKEKHKAGHIVVHGVRGETPMTKTEAKKAKSAENYMKKAAYSKASGKPMKGYKGIPKIVKVK